MRNEAFVEFYDFLYHLDEKLDGNRLHHKALGRFDDTFGIFFKTEYTCLSIFAAEGFQALEHLLPVVKSGGGHVKFDGFRL